MAPEDKRKLYSPDAKRRREQERTESRAKNARLIAESKELRKTAKRLHKESDALIAAFRKDHPEKK